MATVVTVPKRLNRVIKTTNEVPKTRKIKNKFFKSTFDLPLETANPKRRYALCGARRRCLLFIVGVWVHQRPSWSADGQWGPAHGIREWRTPSFGSRRKAVFYSQNAAVLHNNTIYCHHCFAGRRRQVVASHCIDCILLPCAGRPIVLIGINRVFFQSWLFCIQD